VDAVSLILGSRAGTNAAGSRVLGVGEAVAELSEDEV